MFSSHLASRLEGKTINGWHVVSKRKKTEDDDSGAFSSCYFVTNVETGEKAFLKAFNYKYAFTATGSEDSPDILNSMTKQFIYERDLVIECNGHRMNRVVIAIDSGEYKEEGEMFPVPYLVFEVADKSLKQANIHVLNDLVWKLIVFHGALVGMSQLHKRKIAHQDIKPSNILIFGENFSKIADLGRATQLDNHSGHDIGDRRYMPIELFFNHISPDWSTRRFGADFFMLGGLLCFLLFDVNYLALLNSKLPPEHSLIKPNGSFIQELPYLEKAHFDSLEYLKDKLDIDPKDSVDSIIKIIEELCHPCPDKRGVQNFKTKSYGQFSLIPYISKIDLISKKIIQRGK